MPQLDSYAVGRQLGHIVVAGGFEPTRLAGGILQRAQKHDRDGEAKQSDDISVVASRWCPSPR